jgi:ferredoxin
MEIDSETDEVRAVRRTALELLLSDHVGDCLAPCFFACPAHMDIPLMLRQIGDQQLPAAIATIKQDIALPAVLGRVCPKPCEKGCRRNAADGPVAVCELKRFVADQDLAADDPYRPACQADSGKRVAIIGAGPTGLSAAYYLRQQGHACLLLEGRAQAGGRLRGSPADEQLPPGILDAEIAQILRIGIELRTDCPVKDGAGLDELCQQYDAVLVSCGKVDSDQIERWGLVAGRRGIEIDRATFQTERPGVFAAGDAIRGQGLAVRSVADGKEVALSIGQFLSGQAVVGASKPFSSRIGALEPVEVVPLVQLSGAAERDVPGPGADYSTTAAAAQSQRCLVCGCPSYGKCELQRYAELYGANPSRFSDHRRPYDIVGRHSSVIFEPGKCIKCELCVQIAAKAGEPLGLTFVGRGFDVHLEVPFQGGLDEALSRVADQCVAACPTGALRFAKDRVAPG